MKKDDLYVQEALSNITHYMEHAPGLDRQNMDLYKLGRMGACGTPTVKGAGDVGEYAHNEEVNRLRAMGDELVIETMDTKALQKKAKEATVNQKTGRFNRRKRFGRCVLRRSPGYFIKQGKSGLSRPKGMLRKSARGRSKRAITTIMLNDTNRKQLSIVLACTA